jgi:DNA polymerase-3 subunit gamma/tau
MTQVLYRKYRPQDFNSFSGQEHVIKTIQNEIKNGNIAHAYLFSGHRGTGKTSLARLFAKAINCENRNGFEPCNECAACRAINNGSAIDLIEIDAASNRGIDDVKSLRESIKYRPNLLKYKVLILDEAHQLSKDAANALLKILEEPPEYVVFILATTEAHKMIATISSRCQRFDFHKLTIDEIVKKLEGIIEKEKIKIDDDALKVVALSANGSLRDAEGILTQIINFSGEDHVKLENVKAIYLLIKIFRKLFNL